MNQAFNLPMSQAIDLSAIGAELGPRFAQGAAERDAADTFVADHYDALKERKVFSALIPREIAGGGGASYSAMAKFLRELAHCCPSTALALSMHTHIVAANVYNHKNGRPGLKLLEKVAANQVVLISTGANDWLESNGTVTRTDGGYLVSARKAFASGSPKGGVLVTSAPYQDPKEGWQVLHFGVPFTAKGVSLAGDWQTMGMRATGSQTVILDNVMVPEDAIALRRPRGKFHPAWNVILTCAMPLIMSVYLGIAEKIVAVAKEQAARRKGDPVAPFQIGELSNLLTTAQLAVDDMVRINDDLNFKMDLAVTDAILRRKTIAAESVIATAEKALETAGGPGFYRRTGLERLLRDLHGAQFHPLPAKRQHLFTGRVALGLDPIGAAA
jgi:alkylation response protein AidB-like acyl-CoA dehydrogenase